MLLLPALISSFAPAEAAGFEVKTMRAPLSASEVERSLIIGRGWLEFGLGADVKFANGYWDENGKAQDFEGARWLYTTERIGIRYGITRRSEFYWQIPFHYVQLTNEKLGTNTSDFGLGDMHFGYRFEWFRKDAPLTSVVTEVEIKAPSGSEAPASYIGGPNTVESIVLSTGQFDLYIGLKAKQQLGPVAISGGATYIHRFSAVTQFTVEVEEYQFAGRFRPGDEVRVNLEPMVQLGPVAISAEGVFGYRLNAAMGTTSKGIIPDANLDPIVGTNGWYLDVNPGIVAHITRGFDVDLGASIPIRGEDLAFWPLEEISPTRGITGSATLELRY